MFLQALNAALRILTFRAGPQDFPYSPQLTQVIVPLAVLANYLFFVQVLPAFMSLVMAAASVGGMAFVLRGVLRGRNLENRLNQALNSLLLCTGVLTLLLAPAFHEIAPAVSQLAEHPELFADPEALKMSQGAVFLVNLLNIWSFAITVYIFRSAADLNTGLSVLVAIVAALMIAFFVMFCGSIAGGLVGAGAAAK